jgi:hypothetical protein
MPSFYQLLTPLHKSFFEPAPGDTEAIYTNSTGLPGNTAKPFTNRVKN